MVDDGTKALVVGDRYRERISTMQQNFVKVYVATFASVSQKQSRAF